MNASQFVIRQLEKSGIIFPAQEKEDLLREFKADYRKYGKRKARALLQEYLTYHAEMIQDIVSPDIDIAIKMEIAEYNRQEDAIAEHKQLTAVFGGWNCE